LKVEKTKSSFVLVDSNMKIIAEVLDFTITLEQKGLSPNTVKSYLEDLKVFYLWLEQKKFRFYEVKPSNIPNFIEFIDNRKASGKVSPATLNRYLASISSFYRHIEAIGGYVEESPLVKVKGYYPKEREGYLKYITKNWDNNFNNYFRRKVRKKVDRKLLQKETLKSYYKTISILWKDKESLKFRNQLIFRVLYETGYRVSELLHLKINDIDYPDPSSATGNIYLIERHEPSLDRQLKTGERTTPVSNSLLQAIDDYVLYHRPQIEGVEYIFVSHSKANLGQPLTRSTIEAIFSGIAVASEVKYFKLTPHALRHTHASELLNLGVDINVIKDRLGHSNIGTTSKYAKPSVETLSKAHERYLANKGGDISFE
jgi:integrase/recombinase XerD